MGRRKKYDDYIDRIRSAEVRKPQTVEKTVFTALEIPKVKTPEIPKVKTDLSDVMKRFFVMSIGADRAVAKVGKCPAGVWIEVPISVYNSLKSSESWRTKVE